MLGAVVCRACGFGNEPGGGTGENDAPVASLDHRPQGKPGQMERAIEIDAHRLGPDLGWLFPDSPLCGRTDAVIADEDIDRPQPTRRLLDRLRTALRRAQVGDRIVEPGLREFTLAPRGAHDPRTAGSQQPGRGEADTAARPRDQRDPIIDTRHVLPPPSAGQAGFGEHRHHTSPIWMPT